MLFVALYTAKPGVTLEQTMKVRMAWKPPKGVKPIGEYWLQNHCPHTIAIFEADNIATIMEANGPWWDLYNITVVPAISSEEGVKLVPQMMAKR
jgi:hypothetical protein